MKRIIDVCERCGAELERTKTSMDVSRLTFVRAVARVGAGDRIGWFPDHRILEHADWDFEIRVCFECLKDFGLVAGNRKRRISDEDRAKEPSTLTNEQVLAQAIRELAQEVVDDNR